MVSGLQDNTYEERLKEVAWHSHPLVEARPESVATLPPFSPIEGQK